MLNLIPAGFVTIVIFATFNGHNTNEAAISANTELINNIIICNLSEWREILVIMQMVPLQE